MAAWELGDKVGQEGMRKGRGCKAKGHEETFVSDGCVLVLIVVLVLQV